jgi:hypothetical protein
MNDYTPDAAQQADKKPPSAPKDSKEVKSQNSSVQDLHENKNIAISKTSASEASERQDQNGRARSASVLTTGEKFFWISGG